MLSASRGLETSFGAGTIGSQAEDSKMRWLCGCLLVVGWMGLAWAQPVRPSSESAQAWDRFQKALRAGRFGLVTGDPRAALIESVGQSLAAQSRRPIPWHFVLVNLDEPNAACTGEGTVYVTTRLFDLNLSRDELAGILAHEVAHGARQHVEHNQLELQRIGKTLDDRQAVLERSKDLESRYRSGKISRDEYESQMDRLMIEARKVGRQIDQAQSYVQFSSSFSHAQEREADMVGLQYALAAGFQPEGLVRALEKLRDQSVREYGEKALLGSTTHPPLPQRIDRLKELLRRRGY